MTQQSVEILIGKLLTDEELREAFQRNPPAVLTTQALLSAEERLDAAPAAELANRLGLEEARVRALRGGVEILLLLLDYYGLHSLHVSHEGLRHGMILAWLQKGEEWWQ